MSARSLTERVEILDQKLEALQTLTERVSGLESLIVQLRSEVRVEFSAIHDRFGTIDARLEEMQRFMRVLHEDVLTRISLLREGHGRRKR